MSDPVPTTTSVTPTAEAAPATPASMLPAGWTNQVADRIVSTVDAVRDKTTVPAQKIGRAVVYAVPLATAGLVALVFVVVLIFRALYELVGMIPVVEDRAGRSVWIVDLVVGAVLLLIGVFLARKGRARSDVD
jgi:hypothetical protein